MPRERLARSVYDRLEQLTRQMLRRYPQVRQRHETGDVLNSAMIRFLRAIDDTAIRDTRHFHALAAEQLRRELIDLARRLQGAQGRTTELQPGETPPADSLAPHELDSWRARSIRPLSACRPTSVPSSSRFFITTCRNARWPRS